MTFDYEFGLNVVQFMAVLSRVGGILLGFPLFRGGNVPMRIKIIIIVAISVILIPTLPPEWSAESMDYYFDTLGMTSLLISDLLIGLTVSLCIFFMMEVTNLAGGFLSSNIGYGAAQQFDPSTGAQSNSLSVMLGQIFIVYFLSLNMHLGFISILGSSFATLPPGHIILTPDHLTSIITISGDVFIYSFQLSMPVIAVMFVINVAMGIIARFGEDFQVLMLSFPLRLGVGLMILILLMPVFLEIFSQLSEEMLENFGTLLGL